MITFVLAESELELMPPSLHGDPVVQARARKRKRAPEHLVLDQALDHKAMKRLDEGDRRGRPDLAHVFLLLLQDSPLNARGQLRVLVHTRHDGLIRVKPETRIMRNQAKFVQLMEDLLRQGVVPMDNPLLTLEHGWPLARVLHECAGPKVLLDEAGPLARTPRFAELARTHDDITFVLGGFPRGAYRQVTAQEVDYTVRVADEPLSMWSALVPVLAGCEDAMLLP